MPGLERSRRGDPGDEAALKLLGIENSQDIARMALLERIIFEWTEAKSRFFTKKRDFSKALGSSEHRKQAQQQDFIERVCDLTLPERAVTSSK
jgi:hypothetical protein